MTVHQLSRRTMLRGLGVSMALPWMESLRVWGDETAGEKDASQAPTRMAILFAGCGFHRHEWWAKGEGTSMELGKVLASAERLSGPDDCSFAACTMPKRSKETSTVRKRATLLSGAPLVGRGHDSLRHQCRSGRGAADRPSDETAEPGAGLREVESVGAQELLDAVQLAHFLEQPDHADAAGSLSGTWHSTSCSRTGAARATRACSDAVLTDAKDFRRDISHRSAESLMST